MRIEAFSQGKNFAHPEWNEDGLVVMPGVGYAVIDGVTDRNGTRYNGMLSGRYASGVVRRATERFFLAQTEAGAGLAPRYDGPAAFVSYLSEALHRIYVEFGTLEKAEADWAVRACCTIAAVLRVEDRFECVSVGDSGIRINGATLHQVLKPLDDITSMLRREAWHFFRQRGHAAEAGDHLAQRIIAHGTRSDYAAEPLIDAAALAEIERRALESARAAFPQAPVAEIEELLHAGIAGGQGRFLNRDDRHLGFGSLDGFRVPQAFIDHRVLAADEIEMIELFTDGYFKPGHGFGVEAWEAAFREVEEEDPRKLGRYLSTKGTTDKSFTDDRTYLGIVL